MIGPRLTTVFDALEYLGAEGLVTVDTTDVSGGRAYVWQEAREKLGLDAAYFHGNVPVVYFKELEDVDEDGLVRLHRWLWNHNRAPLLIAVLPHEVRVYNCFAPPQRQRDQLTFDHHFLLRAVTLVTDVLALRQQLSQYRRWEVESGRFVHGQEDLFGRDQRVDRSLLENLGHVRRLLMRDGLDKPVANNLLARSIFVRYLEDRGVIGTDFFARFASGLSFRDLLRYSWEETYQLFDELTRRFNGDMFEVDQLEREQVKAHQLQLLGRFLGGQEMLSGQMYFWAYDFNYIPIELISAIYETFLGEEQKRTSAYYTPPEIVDFVLNEVLPFDRETDNIRILDPACGSGIFLVEAYRRLVMNRLRASGKEALSYEELRNLLTDSINGVDVSEDAIRVAAFSCYLALLDFLEPKRIWEEVRFPKLKGTNLFVNDFFDLEAPFNERRYSLIVGNPPWESRLSQKAAEYVSRTRYPVGDKQSAQPFLWRAPTLLADGGTACLLAPSKGVLFNQSGRNREFRRRFFATYSVTQVVDFSTFRRSLFRKAIAPMVAIFYQNTAPGDHRGEELVYCSPHPSPLAEALAGVVVFGDEIKRFSRRQVADRPDLWKIALWGTARDFVLIQDLRARFPSLKDLGSERRWIIGEGLQVEGGDKHNAPELARMRYVPVEALEPFQITTGRQERLDVDIFHRPRDPRLYQGPHVLIRGGALSGGFLAAAFLSDGAVFKDGIIGIAGSPEDTDLLKVVSAYVNSSVARYYHFLTASTWGVERDVVRKTEYTALPVAVPTDGSDLKGQITSLVDRAQGSLVDGDWRTQLDELVFQAYGLTAAERQLIDDTLTTTVDQLYHGTNSSAFSSPSTAELEMYTSAYVEVFEATTRGSRTLLPTIFEGRTPYRAVSFRLDREMAVSVRSRRIASESELDDLLVKLDRVVAEQHSQSFYFRRNVKVFERDAIHIVKPAERRFWTRSAAYNDADSTIAQLLRAASSDAEGEPVQII